jgi:hypothetical protein
MQTADDNIEIRQLFLADRDEHVNMSRVGTQEYKALRERDRIRREKASQQLNAIETPTAEDFYRTAWLFNHGDTPEEAQYAYELAMKARASGHAGAFWLSAAAYDRWQMYSGKAQKYGTQIVPDGKRYRVWDTDPDTTDQERAEYDVPPLAEQHRRAQMMTKTESQPPMESAPDWLIAALVRWKMHGE